jgi:hypothetical protein
MIRAAILLIALATAGHSLDVRAERGVALDVGRIEVDRDLSRGGSYKLPPIGVHNPGTETADYRIGVTYIDDQRGERPPVDWFSFDPSEVTLAPGEAAPVTVTLNIPAGANPDDYEALIQAAVAPEGEGTTVGVAAAARLEFTVKPSNMLEAWQLEAEGWIEDNRPWLILAGFGATVLGTAIWVRRKFTVSIGRRV